MEIKEIIKSAKVIENCVFNEEELTEEGHEKYDTAFVMSGVFSFGAEDLEKIAEIAVKGIEENGMEIHARGGIIGNKLQFFGQIIVFVKKSEKKPEPIADQDRDNVSIIDSFFFYMWNAWGKDECDKVFGKMSEHFWSKWDRYATSNVWGAAEKFYADLDSSYKRMLVDRACKMYNGNKRVK